MADADGALQKAVLVSTSVGASIQPAVPILRMFDLAATKRFYLDYLGCALDWQDGEGDRPFYLQVSRGDLVLHLSSQSDDGTPRTAVPVEIDGVDSLHEELRSKNYPFLNPGVGDGPGNGREMTLIDPASNRLRFYERAKPAPPDPACPTRAAARSRQMAPGLRRPAPARRRPRHSPSTRRRDRRAPK